MQHKLAFVGPSIVHKAFSEMDSSWDLQIPLETLEDFEQELTLSEEEASISKETSVIIFFSRLFDKNPDKFAELISFSAPYSVVCILIPRADLNKKEIIEKKIIEAQNIEAQNNSDYNSMTPFFFCEYENAQIEIFTAIEKFSKNVVIADEIKESVKAMLPEVNVPVIEQFEDFGEYEDEDIIIPQADPSATGEVIAVTSSKGGSGKSTVSVVLGTYIAKASITAAMNGDTPAPLKVCIVDMDVRDGQLGFLNGAMKPTIIDIVYSGAPTPENIIKGVYHSSKLDCDFIFATKRPRNAREIPPSFYVEMIQNLRSMYDVIILDTSVNYLDPLLEQVAYPIADKIVLVSDMGIASICGCSRWINEVLYAPEAENINIDQNKIGVVINKAMPDINMSPAKIEKAVKGLPILSMIPSSPSLIGYAANTSELGQILNHKPINNAFKRIAEAVITSHPLGDVPSQ